MGIHIIPYKPLARCGIDELAAQINNRARRITGGVMFARKEEKDEKDIARDAILGLLTLDVAPEHLSILCMPGVDWCFEAKLLKRRDPNWRLQQSLDNTRFTCVENDRYVYYSAATRMPGNKHCLVRALERPEYAERAQGQGIIDRFIFANVDELMAHGSESFDFVWLDYTGPLNLRRMEVIRRFWATSVRKTLVVTALKARWNKDTGRVIDRHGGCMDWLRASLPGRAVHAIEYQDGASPMVQFAVSK